jgi:malonate-semialdehyde dehydrogenase (acetylating)/methylmalonate-semialdehyde dehydrogenase
MSPSGKSAIKLPLLASRTGNPPELKASNGVPSNDELPVLSHWIDGAESLSSGDRTAPVYDPARGIETKRVALANASDIEAAISSAHKAFPAWRDLSITKRQQIMFRVRELLNERKGELAQIITAEHGKVVSDALGEITRGLEVVELATGFPHLIKGEHSENVSSGVDVYSTKSPLGVVGIISPFNFPAMVPLWFLPIAIAAGNTVVLKPSEKDPTAANWLAELFTEAGLPDGVFNVLHGDKEAVDGLLEHPDVKAISFVGSTPVAQYIYETAARNGKRVQALGGAKNHMLVLPDADLELTADAAINAGFGSAGERCMAISVIVAVEPVADELIEKITSRMATLKIGDGRRNCDMGPLVTRQHRDKVASYIDIATEDGAKVVVDGRGINVDGDESGFWLGPTLIDEVPVSSRAYTDEIFGPVLAVVRVSSYEEGLDLINSSAYGNGTAIFTNDGGAARRFQNEVEVGMVGINVPIPVPVAYYSFGGFKDSIFGSAKAYGLQGFQFFTREKAITSRWLDPSHGGINLGFPQN